MTTVVTMMGLLLFLAATMLLVVPDSPYSRRNLYILSMVLYLGGGVLIV